MSCPHVTAVTAVGPVWTDGSSERRRDVSEGSIVILCIIVCVFLSAIVGNEIREERLRSMRK